MSKKLTDYPKLRLLNTVEGVENPVFTKNRNSAYEWYSPSEECYFLYDYEILATAPMWEPVGDAPKREKPHKWTRSEIMDMLCDVMKDHAETEPAKPRLEWGNVPEETLEKWGEILSRIHSWSFTQSKLYIMFQSVTEEANVTVFSDGEIGLRLNSKFDIFHIIPLIEAMKADGLQFDD